MQGPLVLVPTYIEARNIVPLLKRIRAALPEGRVLVIDDNSPDGTADLAEAVGRELGGVDVLRRSQKTGLGDAYRAGFSWGLDHGAQMFVTMDADFSHDPDALPGLVAACVAGADLVVGSRYVPGASIETSWPRRRKALSRWANRYIRFALRLDVADNTTGYRVYRADLVRRTGINHSRADGYAFQIEAVYRATSARASVREEPIVFIDRAAGHSKLSGRTIFEALALVTWWGVRSRTGHPVIEFDPAGTAG
jgi:dolichol-phosphate mannosyltransferase